VTELKFKGKEFVYNHHLSVPFRPLEIHPKKGIGKPSLDGNLVIQGDNLHALKALLPIYAGKVDCIFIDPPYNTGNEDWCYNDNVNAPMIKEWLDSNPVGIEDGLRHDKWCAMMWPRLRLLHELLSDEGSLWVTLDDNEIHRARAMLDEIFGEEQFVCKIVTQSNKRGQTYKSIAKTHEYILVYGKSEFSSIRELETEGKNLTKSDSQGPYEPRELRNRNPKYGKHNRPNLFYPFFVSEDVKDEEGNYVVKLEQFEGAIEVLPFNSSGGESCWRWGAKRSEKKIADESTEFLYAQTTKKGAWRVFEKYRKESVKAKTIWSSAKHISEQGTVELGKMGLAELFQFPKPFGLLEDVISIATSEDSIILDSFAGSGTTAHAVLEANNRDGGERKFILVEMEDYANSVTAERIRRAIKGYKFTGTEGKELLRQRITWRTLQKTDEILGEIDKIELLHGHEYDSIKKKVKEGELIVAGEKEVQERTDGLGGEFTYCTLGAPIELDKILSGDTLPDYQGLGAVLFHMATNQSLETSGIDEGTWYLGQAAGQHVWLIYMPDLEWLKTPDAALTLTRAKSFAEKDAEKRHLVFAPARYVSQKMLDEQNIPVEFVPLPFALYRVDRG